MTFQITLLVAVLLLVVSKVVAIIHLNLSETLYFDLDRLIALIIFLGVYHQWSRSKFNSKPYLLLAISGVLISSLATLFGIAFEKMLILFFMTAFVEEILLRGVLFELLLKKLTPKVTLVSTSVFFTLVHPAIYSNALYGLAVLMTGLLLGFTYLFFRNQNREMAIVYVTILHGFIILSGLLLGVL